MRKSLMLGLRGNMISLLEVGSCFARYSSSG